MQIKTILQEAIADSDDVLTIAVITNVTSHCILARQLMDVLGKPPTHSDLEILGGNDTWTIAWSQPQLTLDVATAAINQALSPNYSGEFNAMTLTQKTLSQALET